MSTTVLVILIVVVIVVIAALAFGLPAYRRRQLRDQFGPEYDTAVETAGDRRSAESELRERQRRHAEFDIRPLSAESRESYAQKWAAIQEKFVDDPANAVSEADALVTALIAERGYPTDGYDQQVSDLSVEHAATLTHYRAAHDISVNSAAGSANTEDLRQALVHYRAMFDGLLGTTSASEQSVSTEDAPAADVSTEDVLVEDASTTGLTTDAAADDVPVETDADVASDTDVPTDTDALAETDAWTDANAPADADLSTDANVPAQTDVPAATPAKRASTRSTSTRRTPAKAAAAKTADLPASDVVTDDVAAAEPTETTSR